MQRMASLKRNEHKVDDGAEEPILTSASIRGPEDFDMFVQGVDTMKYTLTPQTVRDKPKVSEIRTHVIHIYIVMTMCECLSVGVGVI